MTNEEHAQVLALQRKNSSLQTKLDVLTVAVNTLDYCYSKQPGRFAEALTNLKELVADNQLPTDDELPGMWSNSDTTGGQHD